MNKIKSLTVRNIFELGFQLNEGLRIGNEEKKEEITLDFNIDLEFQENGKIIGFLITSNFHLKQDSTEVIASSKVKTEFQLTYENKVKMEDGKLDLPDQHWITMLSISISHARALMARSTNGTVLKYEGPLCVKFKVSTTA